MKNVCEIMINTEILTDGSTVFNISLNDEHGNIVTILHCTDAESCGKLAAALKDLTVNF